MTFKNIALIFCIVFFLAVSVTAMVLSVKVSNLRSEVSDLKKDTTTLSVQNRVFRNTIQEMNIDFVTMDKLLDDCKGKGLKKELPSIEQIKRKK